MKVLISGASIAGLASAYWLRGSGHQVTVLERADGRRSGGISIDVRDEALDVVEQMGLRERISAARVPHPDVFRFRDRSGAIVGRLLPTEDVYDSPDDIEISRDTLVGLLAERVAELPIHYERWIARVDQRPDTARVHLNDGSIDDYDLVVGADGLHSAVRRLAFGPECHFVEHMGLYVGIVRECRGLRVIDGSDVLNLPGRMVALRSDGYRTSALLGYRAPLFDYDHRDVAVHRRLVQAAFADVDDWLVPEVVAEIQAADDFYFDAVGKVRMSSWWREHCVLVGDAGYCPSFFSGMGTTLALVGARSLARALDSDRQELSAALRHYDESMRGSVERAQGIAKIGLATLFPATWEEIAARNATLT